MTDFPFDKLAGPLAGDSPCGPDLELEGDLDFMNFTARIEGLLPQSFFAFDRKDIDFPAEYKSLAALSARTLDLRLIVPLAKLMILNRDLEGFERSLGWMARLLDEQWDQVHPQPMDGDSIMRVICLQTLDDMPHAVLPLQSAVLFKTRRFGIVTFRAYLLSEGKIPGRKAVDDTGEDEKVPTAGDIRTAINEAEVADLVAARDCAARMVASISAIEAALDTKGGAVGALRFAQLRPLAEAIHHFLASAAVSRDPSLGPPVEALASGESGSADGAAPLAQAGSVASSGQAREALAAAAGYFARKEPSSPARLLIAQANELLGKGFYEAIYALVPDYAGSATVRLGRELPLTLPVERMSQLIPAEVVEDTSYEVQEAPPPAEDVPADGAEVAPVESPPPVAVQAKVFAAANRHEALQLLEAVSAYFRGAEPSSPIPFLLDQARVSAGRDFVSLLRDMLPPQALRVDE